MSEAQAPKAPRFLHNSVKSASNERSPFSNYRQTRTESLVGDNFISSPLDEYFVIVTWAFRFNTKLFFLMWLAKRSSNVPTQ